MDKMALVYRYLQNELEKDLFQGKTLILYGARQTGKTTLIGQLLQNRQENIVWMNGDEADVRHLFTHLNSDRLIPYLQGKDVLVLDEAQRIPETGLAIKIIHDHFPAIQLIVTGSSSFELTSKIMEPMTGRKFEYFLYPFSFNEMTQHHGLLTEKRLLEHRLIMGYYPEIVMHPENDQKRLDSLVSSYLYKDLLKLEHIRKPVLLDKIIRALALQVGREVSYNELAQLLNSDKETVEKYIDLLEKTYIVFRVPAFSRNVRNEIKRNRKIYFYDNGIRNAVLGNYLPLHARTDTGELWENFLMSERRKFLNNRSIGAGMYFWRTTQQQEIDYVEERRDGRLLAFEFKWNPRKKCRLSSTFASAYPSTPYAVISPENIEEFLNQ
ncbi:ATP-binding protein [Fidelibacter multiformis]|uniref:ATP-binding protein n=1 Tax=Fidelibacter multiformis TaxID=3377529 RepID=UPI0037DC711A